MTRDSFLNKVLSVCVMLSLILMPISMLCAQTNSAPVTQGDFAKYLVRALGLESQLPIGASTFDYTTFLEQQGIFPPGGFDDQKPLTKKDMAFIMMRTTGLENKVLNRMRGKSVVGTTKAVIRNIKGTVQFKRGLQSKYANAQVNDQLYTDDSIKTGNDSSVVIQLGRYSGAFLGDNTEITIEELSARKDNSENIRIFIKHGWVSSKVKKLDRPVNYETRTTTTVAGVMGTTYCQTSSNIQDQLMSCTGGIWFYLLDKNGNPTGEPKVLKIKEKVITDPTGEEKPKFTLIPEDENGKILSQAEFIKSLTNLDDSSELGKGTSSESAKQQSTYQMKFDLEQGNDDAYQAVLEVLNESGILIEETGAAATADSTITQAQLTQFLNDLLLSDIFDRYNTDATPFGG